MGSILRFLREKYSGRMFYIRTWYYSKIFKSFGLKSRVLGSIRVIRPENISLGVGSTLNSGCFLNAVDAIAIGDHVHISPYVIINTVGLDYTKEKEKRDHLRGDVSIGSGSWIGSGVIINPGVHIGTNVIVGAGAVVTKDISSNVLIVGVPARPIKALPPV